jgi:hypothetical protein
MDVVMLGHSDAGKTSYVALMYELMSTGIDGFSIAATDDDDDRRLKAAAAAIHDGRYPPPSDRRDEYSLLLRHGSSAFFEFRWRDYRGGALTERSDSPQAAALLADLEEADGIVVFVDAGDLLSNPRARGKTRSLSFLVSRALAERDRITPLVIAWTKWDLLPESVDADRLWQPFESLVRAAATAENVAGTAIPLVCGPQPENVAIPVVWCLALGVVSYAKRLEDEYQRSLSLASEAAGKDTLRDRLVSPFKNEPTWRQIALRRLERAQAERAAWEALIKPGNRLLEHVRDIPIFAQANA